MNIVIHSRRSIESADIYSLAFQCAAICIAYPTGRLHRVQPMGSLDSVLHVRFSDCDERGVWAFPENKDMEAKAIPMTRGNAVDILDFVRALPPEVKTLHVACFGGVSRSRGVAAGLCAVFGWDDSAVYAEGSPNAWCKVLIVRTAREEASRD